MSEEGVRWCACQRRPDGCLRLGGVKYPIAPAASTLPAKVEVGSEHPAAVGPSFGAATPHSASKLEAHSQRMRNVGRDREALHVRRCGAVRHLDRAFRAASGNRPRRAIETARSKPSERTALTPDMVVRELAKIAFANMADYSAPSRVATPISTSPC